jgi:hypothetical protein
MFRMTYLREPKTRASARPLINDADGPRPDPNEETMIVLGVILLIIGWATGISILYTVGSILLVVGLVMLLLGSVGHGIGGRRWYY